MLSPGTLLGSRYEIESAIGHGGMGAVYRAVDRRLSVPVAVKETFFPAGTGRGAFAREARLLASLDHPALPRVTDYFPEGDGAYLVMELVPGQDLRGRLNELGGPCPLPDVLSWADQILAALDYLHGQDPPVIHRDVKPDNLKVLPNGRVKLLDFGLAKGMAPRPFNADSVVSVPESIQGGTGYYASPEQLSGQGTDARSDLYSLGATLYELLTAQRPPDARLREYVLATGLPEALRPANELNPAIPAAVADVLGRALQMKPDERPSSAAALRSELRAAAKGARSTPKPAPAPSPAPPPKPRPQPSPSLKPAPAPRPRPADGKGWLTRVLGSAGVQLVAGPVKVVAFCLALAIFAIVGAVVGAGLGDFILQPIMNGLFASGSSYGAGSFFGMLIGAAVGAGYVFFNWEEWTA